MSSPWRLLAAAGPALAAAAIVAGCGSDSSHLEVAAAASLRRAFGEYAHHFAAAGVRYSFAGSDALAAQIEQGVRPDVFASANTQLPDMLFARGLVERPVVFATNRLVVAVPRGSTVTSVSDLGRPGTTIAVGSPTVPVGRYTESVLARLPASARERVRRNIHDREPDVTGIVGKLTQGAVGAGLLYATDVTAAGGQLRAIDLPQNLEPDIAYGVAVVSGTSHPAAARTFVAGLLHGAGRATLLRDGFLPPR